MTVTFIEYIKPVMYITKFLGLTFFSLSEYNIQNCGDVIFDFIIGLPVICSYIYCTIVAVLDMTNLKSPNKNISINYMKILCLISILDFALSTMYNIIYRNKIKSIVYLINKHVNSNFDKKRHILIFKIVLLLTLFCVLSLKVYGGLLIHDNHIHYHIVVKTEAYFNFFTTFTYYTSIVEIKNQFSNINASLRQLQISAAGYKQTIAARRKKCENRCKFIRIVQLVEIHQRLSEVANTVCKTLSPRVLIQVTYYFILTVFGSSPTMKIWQDTDETVNWKWFSWILLGLAWFTLLMISVSTVCYSWNSIAQEGRKSSLIIHEYWNEHAEEQSIYLMQDFQSISLQMYHGRLHFMACGFFYLDFSLLYTIIAAMATYMVILSQFDEISK